jgi:hypothetical protein
MHNRWNLFFILILVLVILSMSFVSASDNITDDSNDGTVLSVTDDTAVEENSEDVSVEKSSGSVLGVSNDDQSDENESNLTNSDAQVLGVSNDDSVLGNDISLTGWGSGTAQEVMDAIVACSNSGGGTVYLNGRTYTGSATLTARQNQIIEIKNVTVEGRGSNGQMATFEVGADSNVLSFDGYTSDIIIDGNPVLTPWGSARQGRYNTSGCSLENVVFQNIKSTGRLLVLQAGL